MAGPQLARDGAGNIWDTSSGSPVLVRQAPPPSIMTRPAPPAYPYEGPQAQANLTRTQQEVRQAEATASATTSKTNSEAISAGIKAKTDQINYMNQSGQVPGNANLRGEEYLKSLPAGMADMVRTMDAGRLGVPINMRNPQMMQVVAAATHFDPSFDAAKYNTRLAALKAGAVGRLGSSDNALNTAIVHAGMLHDQASGTAGHDTGFGPLSMGLNALQNWSNKGSPGLVTYNDTAGKLAGEEAQAYGMGTQGERDTLLQHFDPNMPLAAKQAAIHNAMDLFASKMAANLHQYQWGNMGNQKPSLDLLDPEARAVLQRIAPDVLEKHFSDQPDPMALSLGVSQTKGGTPPPSAPPGAPSTDPNAPPTVGPQGGVPHADYSGMVGGPQQGVATGGYRNEFDPVIAAGLSGLIRKGASYETAAAYTQSHGFVPPPQDAYMAAVAFQHQHPGAVPNVEANRQIPTTMGERLSASPLAAGFAGAVTGATAGLSDVAGRTVAGPQWDANRAAMAALSPKSDLAGNVLGGMAGMFAGGKLATSALAAGAKGGLGRDALALAIKNPVKTSVLGDAAYGTTYGASENPDNPLGGAVAGLVTAPIGSLAGQTASKALGAASRGVVDPAVQRLRAAGIPLTVGEVLGGGAKKAQDAMTSVFGPGNMVARRYADGRQALNQAAFNQAGQIVGSPINKVGQAGIQALDAAKSRAYSNALDPVTLDLNNPQAINDIGGALNTAKGIQNVDQARDIATGGLTNYIGGAAPNGIMSGTDFQQAYRGLSRLGRQSSGRVYGHEIGNALGQGQDALVGALQSQNPGAYEGFLAANRANRHLSVLSKAVDAAKNQVGDNGEPLFTPAQLGTAASANGRTYSGAVASASGNRPFNQLALDSQKVMSSKLPESGTFPRQLMGLALTGGLSGVGGMFGGSQNGVEGAAEGAAIPLGLLSLLGTRRGQQLLTASLLKRPPGARQFGNYLITNPQLGGDLATTGALQLLPKP